MRQMMMAGLIGLVGLLELASCAQADITLAKLFTDHMVLQRNATVRIWGTSEPNDTLTISFAGQTYSAQANGQGEWSTTFPTGAEGGPFQLEVASEQTSARLLLNDVMLGEVWICSGQSNMEWSVEQSLNPKLEIEQAKDFSNIRLFRVHHHSVPQPVTEFHKVNPWVNCSPDTVKSFSAVAYQFAKRISKEKKIPIGLIETAWGGTRCEAWISANSLKQDPFFQPLLEHWLEADQPNSQHRPSNLYNGMIAPLKGFAFRGVIWYQGEANVGRGAQFARLFPTLIADWRKQLGEGSEFPFYFVQLAPFRYGNQPPEALPEVWDGQLKTFKSVPRTGMVVTTDIGNTKNIHPKNKQEVGRRLALWALANEYSDLCQSPPTIVSGPIYDSMKVVDDYIELTFSHVGDGLEARGGTELTFFTICGEDRQFQPAQAEIVDGKIRVRAEGITKPVAVRFGWVDTAEPNLFNSAGLPASPFRTDDFPLRSEGVNF